MNPNWLTALAPAHAPPPPPVWPPSPGWWILAGLTAAVVAGALGWWRAPRLRRRRGALRELRRIRAAAADPQTSARAIESLLRRYAMAVFGRDRVARLTGEAWLAFLGEEGATALAGASGRALLGAAFGDHPLDQRAEWLAGAEAFVRRAGRKHKGGQG
jgi:hypothetical protein